MLLLLFQIGDNLYAIDTAQVVEVIPMVVLRKMYQVPDYVAGIFNYHGDIVSVIDLCRLIQGTACRDRFSTRIIIVNYTAKNGTYHRLGLMAEQVTETLSRPAPNSKTSESASDVPYLGEMLMDEKGMIQQIHWEHLIPDVQLTALLAGGNRQTNGARHN
jgi:chemotaxis-related protein WspB